jgi:nuclear pore complex protein Nup93
VRALQKLGELSFVPTERFRLQLCASSVNQLHPAVADRLPSVLLAAATALAASGKREQLQTVVAFAAAVSNRISQAMYQQLNQLQAGVSA